MMKELRNQLIKASDKLGAEDVSFEINGYIVVYANDEMIEDDTVYEYAINADENDDNIYKLSFNMAENYNQPEYADDWVEYCDEPYYVEVAFTGDYEILDFAHQIGAINNDQYEKLARKNWQDSAGVETV